MIFILIDFIFPVFIIERYSPSIRSLHYFRCSFYSTIFSDLVINHKTNPKHLNK